MATVSERLGAVGGFGLVRLDDENPTSAHIYLPENLSKALEAQEHARSKALARRQRQQQLALQDQARRRTRFGRFYDDLGVMVSNEASGHGIRKPLGTLSFAALRALGDASWIDRLIINARKSQARRFGQVCEAPGEQLGFRCVHRKYKNIDFDTDNPDIRKRCKEMDERLRRVTSPIHKNFADVLENMIEEELVIDRRVFILPKGRGGDIASYHMIDGETIRPRLEVLAAWMTTHGIDDPEVAERRIQRHLLASPPIDVTTGRRRTVNFLDAAYVQVLNEQVVDAWRAEDIHVAVAHPSIRMNHWGYGTSPLESSWGLSLLFMRAMRYNQNLFDVNYPEAILLIPGGYDEEGLGAFKRNVFDWDEQEASTRLPIVSGVDLDADAFKPELLRLRDTPKDMLMTELIRFVCNLKCAAYGMHPSEINVMPDGQGGAIVNVDQTQGDEIADATERGFHSLMTGQGDTLTEALILPDYDDLMYIVEGLDEEGEQATAARIESYSQHSTFNELRAMRDQKPLAKGIPTDPGDFVVNGDYLQIVQMMSQQAQAQAQQDMGGYEQGNFGEPGGGGGGGDSATQGGPGGGMAGAPGGQPVAPGAPGAGGAVGGPATPGGGQPGVPAPPPGGGGGGLPPGARGGGAPGAARRPPPGRQGKGNPLFRSVVIDPQGGKRWRDLVGDDD